MSNSYTLGKNGKFGEIDFSKLRSGITKEELGIQEGSVLDSIWKQIDTNQEGDSKDRLDRQELNHFIAIIKDLCGKDNNLSTGEAKKFETEDGKKLGRKHKEELLTFLSKLSELTKGVAKVETEPATNIEIITYEDGHTEKVKPDGSKTIISKDEKTITEKDADGNTTKETVKTDNGETVTEYEPGSTNPKKQTITGKGTQSVILYSQGKPIKQTTTIEETGEIQEFDFVEDQPVLRKTTNPKTGETVVYSDGKPASRSITTETEEGTRVSNTIYDGNNSTENVSINGKDRYQKKVIDGQEYEVCYDENGNTTGVIVQNGESVKAIAEKFGVKPEDLVKANAHLLKGGKHSFNAGDEIVIPRKMEADEYVNAQEGRKDAEGAKADYRAAVARREAERQAKIGTEIARGQNGYYVTQTSDGKLHYWNSKGQEITEDSFKAKCPNIYEDVKAKQRGATQRTHNKYDVDAIRSEASELAEKIYKQIKGASLNENTINMLRGITPENVAFVVSEYTKYGISLAKHIDNEWGLDIETVKEHVCSKLAQQAKACGLKTSDYTQINNLKSLENWIDKVAEAIRNKMTNATETYYATDAEETQRQQSAENKKTAKTSAEQIVNDLIKSTSGWNNIDKIKAAIARIDSPEELEEVNRLLTIKGYPPTDKYSPIEHFIYDESDHSISHTYNSSDYLEQVVQGWIDNGTLKGQDANEAQARMAARVLYDGGDGFGTNCDKIKKAVRMIKCPKPTGNREADNKQAREVYRLVNEMIKKHNTFYGLGSPCTDLLDYCEGEMWDGEVKYLNGILAETNAIQGEEKAQAIADLTQEAVEGGGTDIEYLEQAIRAIDSPEDRKAVEAKFEKYCKAHNIKPQIEGQSYIQAILYDECDTFMGISTDHKEIRKFNEMLIEQGAYTDEEIVNLRAEQAALQILEGDFDNIKDAVEQLKDPKVLAKVEQLLTTKGYKSLDEFLSKKLNQTKSDLINAELASNNLLPNEKAADVAYRLIKNSDFNTRAQGIRAIRNEAVAKLVDEKLKQEGSSLTKVMEQFNKEKAEYKSKADFWDGLGKFIPIVGGLAEDLSDAYRANTDGSDNMFVEMDQAQDLTPQQKSAYARTVKIMEQKLAQMEKDYKAALDSQGAVSWAVNRFCENYGIGTTREEIEARIEHDKETVRLLKLAAEGKLGKMVDGKSVAVTFEEVFKERNVGTDFDAGKVEKVEDQAQMLVAMNYAKTNIAICWEELENGLNSSDSKRLSVAIIDTLEKLSNMTGKKLSLAGYGYSIKDSIIVDSSGNPVSVDKLKELANQLKQGLLDVIKDLFEISDEQFENKGISTETSYSKMTEFLGEAFNSRKESFKQEFKDAFGQDCPDEMVEDYISTIETGTMVVNMVVLIGAVVVAPLTGGGSLGVFLAGAGASLGLNALEHSTDANGWTNAEWTSDAEQAMWDGLLSALGMKVGMIADAKAIGAYKTAAQNVLKKLVPNISAKTLDRASVCISRVRAMGYEVTSDTIQSLVQACCQTGEFNEEFFLDLVEYLADPSHENFSKLAKNPLSRDLLLSITGNSVGHAFSGVSEVRGGKANADVDTPSEAPTADAARRGRRDDIADGETARNADQSLLTEDERAMVDEGIEGTPTREEVGAYQRENGYHEPAPDERVAIDENNARAAEADAEAHRIENSVDDASADALRRARESAVEPDTSRNGLFKDAEGNEYTLTDGKITEIRTSDGRVVTDELKIAEFTSKRNINPNDLEAVPVDTPHVETDNSDVPEAKPGEEPVLDEKTPNAPEEPVGVTTPPEVDAEVVKPSYEDPVKAASLRKKLGGQLFAIYQGVERSIDTLKDITGYNKIKTVIANKFKNSPAEFSELITRLNNKAKKIGLKIVETSVDRTARMGKSLSKFYDKIESAIDKMTDIKRFNKLLDKITTKFSDFKDDMKALLDKLYDKAQALGLSIKESIHDVYTRVGIKAKGVKDDIWRNFAPSDPNAKPSTSSPSIRTAKLQKGQSVEIQGSTKLTLANRVEIDLNDPRIKAQIDSLPEGGRLTIGREGDIRINDSSNMVSRVHVIIEKRNGKLYVIDNSTNGTTVTQKTAADSSSSSRSKSADNVDPVKERAYKRFDKNATPEQLPENGYLDQKSQYILNLNQMPSLRLIDGTIVDLNSPEIINAIANLKDGEYLTLGRTGDFEVSSSRNISRHHIIIAKENGQIQLKDVSSFGHTKALSQSERELRANSIRKFNKNSPTAELRNNTPVDSSVNYILDFNNLPKLRLFDGTIIDLNNPKYYNAIQHLREGGFITLGRTGSADIGISNSATISRHHILLTIQDGELIMKDISSNGGTYCVGDKNNSSRSGESNESGRSDRSGNAGSSTGTENLDQAKIKEYKELLGIPEDKPLTEEILKKAYRKKALEWHPDRHPENVDEANEMMRKINVARDALQNVLN